MAHSLDTNILGVRDQQDSVEKYERVLMYPRD